MSSKLPKRGTLAEALSDLSEYAAENGLVDVCQQPYVEFIAAARRSHARIYRVAAGEMSPFDRLPDALTFG
jgi:hypothetical protein